MPDNLYRRSMLSLTGFGPVERIVKRIGFSLGVRRFVAGETLDDAMAALVKLQQSGYDGILDLLGEFVDSSEGVDDMVNQILLTLDRLAHENIDRYMSMKPTQLGLGMSKELAYGHAGAIAERAGRAGARICLDMESHPYAQATLDLYRALLSDGHNNVSTVLQSYLHRSVDDMRAIARDFPESEIRLVKGAYKEPAAEAHQDKQVIAARFVEMLDIALDAGMRVNIATHDERLIASSLARIQAHGVAADRYEFQLLYGIKPKLQASLKDSGHAVRIYVPYGRDWYGYFSRRLAERPANLAVVIRGLFG